MRTWCFCLTLWLVLLSCGCATVPDVRDGAQGNVRTLTQIGDRPLSVASGDPGRIDARGVSEALEAPEPTRTVAGRVVSSDGLPVPNAEVRIGVNSASGGRVERVFTDEVGRFTLHDLRAGSSYAIVAEWPDRSGDLQTGRQRVTAPARDVEIALAPVGTATEGPSGSKVGRASQREYVNERLGEEGEYLVEPFSDTPARSAPGRINEEDLPLPEEAETLLHPDRDPGEMAASKPVQWHRSEGAPAATASAGETGSLLVNPDSSGRPDSTPWVPPAAAVGLPDEPLNPLPPARELPASSADEVGDSSAESASIFGSPAAPRSGAFAPAGSPDASAAPGPRPDEQLIKKALSGSPDPAVSPLNDPSRAGASEGNGAASPPSSPSPDAPESDLPSTTLGDPATTRPAPPAEQVDPQSTPPGEVPTPAQGPGGAPADGTEPEPLDMPGSAPPSDEGIAPNAQGAFSQAPTTKSPDLEAPSQGVDLSSSPTEAPAPETATPSVPSDEPGEASNKEAEFEDPPPLPDQPVAEPLSATAPRKRMTWGELAATAGVSAEAVTSESPAQVLSRGSSSADPVIADPAVVPASCRFDRKDRRLVDFQMPDVNARPFRFRDLDSDFVLLDFWGTWCGPCIRSVPHLVELQNRFGADRLKVVGIAYEEGALSQRVATVKSVSRRLGINYDVLIGEADGKPCPLRNALNVQVYPTMVLLDREGRVVWRDQGATPVTLSRLDRVIATNLDQQIARR